MLGDAVPLTRVMVFTWHLAIVTFSIVAIRKMWLTLATTWHLPAHRPQFIEVFEFWTASEAGPLNAKIKPQSGAEPSSESFQ